MRPFARFVRCSSSRPAVLAACLGACMAALPLLAPPVLAQLSTAGSLLLQQGVGGVPGTADGVEHFGQALVAGDFDGDGRDDLAIGAPFEDDAPVSDVGAVTVIYSAAGLPVGASSALFRKRTEAIVEKTLSAYGGATCAVTIRDQGALAPTLAARLETALERAGYGRREQ